MSILDSMGNFFAAGDTTADAAKVVAPELVGIGDVDTANGVQSGATATSGIGYAQATDSPFLPSWASKAITPILSSIMTTAMRPKPFEHAPAASGHGVQANPAGVMKPFEEVEKMASDNPLDGLTQFTHLF